MMVMADGIGYVGRRALAQVGRLLLLALLLLNGPDIVGATRHLFSVHDDLLGFPQFEVLFPRSFVSESDAAARLLSRGSVGGQRVEDGQAFAGAAADGRAGYGNGDDDGDEVVVDGKKMKLQHEYKRMVHQGRQFLCEIPVVLAKGQSKVGDKIGSIGAGAIGGGEGAGKGGVAENDGSTPIDGKNDKNGENDDGSDAMAVQAAKIAEEEQRQRQELARAAHHGSKLLRGMRGTCSYFLDGWWTYSFCYGDRVRQYHQLTPSQNVPVYPPQEDPTALGFDLGVFVNEKKDGDAKSKDHDSWEVEERESPKSKQSDTLRLETQGETRYLVQTLTGGTICDLTGRNRKVEVQYHCRHQSNDQIGIVKEISTCSYLMLVYTPRLCSDVAFQPAQESEPHAIMCEEIVADSVLKSIDDDISAAESSDSTAAIGETEGDDVSVDEQGDAYSHADLSIPFLHDLDFYDGSGFDPAAHQDQEPEPEPDQAPKKPPVVVVGGTTVGAKKLVGGTEGRTISKSVIVGGGQETYVDTIASSDGRMLSEAEMKKLRVMNVRDVEKIKRDLAKVAGGKGWKLDVVDTPRGREFRGVIETDGKGSEGSDDEKDGQGSHGGGDGDDGSTGKADKERDDRGGGQGKGRKHKGTEETYKDEL